MKISIVFFVLTVAVFNGVSSSWLTDVESVLTSVFETTVSDVTEVVEDVDSTLTSMAESLQEALQIVNLTEVPEDLNSTLDELKNDVIFKLFTSSSPETAEVIYIDDNDTLASTYFNANNPTRLIIHGWLSSSNKTVTTSIRDAYLNVSDYNVIAVDWTAYSSITYTYARSKITTVGRYVGLFIDYLESQGVSLDDLIVIGHSLGAHIAGIGCRTATNEVGILIALDPAGPLFNAPDDEARMTPTDAAFVQVIHTCAGLLGHKSNLGTVDLWPNGGEFQNGCSLNIICSHSRSYNYLAESISGNKTFLAHACNEYSLYEDGSCSSNSTTYLGGSTLDTTARGVYYLDTNSDSTYAKD